MISPSENGYFKSFGLFKRINKNKLIKGEMYYIKDPMYKCKNEYWRYYAIFKHYEEGETETSHAYFKYANSPQWFQQYLPPTIVYRCVTREEFYKKVKEKYDRKCLNIILKRLLDESFQW
jgi:hypothetical protein